MKIMLIGGNNNSNYEITKIDREIVKMTTKDNPIFLFIGLASNFSDSYYDTMKKIYKKLGCECLYLKKKNIINNPNIVKEKIQKADIIYIGGGDTYKLINTIKEYQIDNLLKEAANRNCVIAGISAGAIALSNSGLSDYEILQNISDKHIFIDGLGILDIDICPHADDFKRITDLKKMIKNTNRKVLTLENGTALKLEGSNLSIVTNDPDAKICYMFWNNDNFIIQKYQGS